MTVLSPLCPSFRILPPCLIRNATFCLMPKLDQIRGLKKGRTIPFDRLSNKFGEELEIEKTVIWPLWNFLFKFDYVYVYKKTITFMSLVQLDGTWRNSLVWNFFVIQSTHYRFKKETCPYIYRMTFTVQKRTKKKNLFFTLYCSVWILFHKQNI